MHLQRAALNIDKPESGMPSSAGAVHSEVYVAIHQMAVVHSGCTVLLNNRCEPAPAGLFATDKGMKSISAIY